LAAAIACAAVVAGNPTAAVQGTVRALWAATEAGRAQGFAGRAQGVAQAPHLIALGNLSGERQAELVAGRRREGRAGD
jgi:hypothetical protein